jgi:perosamine synthetase
LQLPVEKKWAFNVYWMYAIVLKSQHAKKRDQLIEHLWSHGIQSRTFFCPMNQQPVLRKSQEFRKISCPVADRLWESGLYLPSAWNLTEATIIKISDVIRSFFENLE